MLLNYSDFNEVARPLDMNRLSRGTYGTISPRPLVPALLRDALTGPSRPDRSSRRFYGMHLRGRLAPKHLRGRLSTRVALLAFCLVFGYFTNILKAISSSKSGSGTLITLPRWETVIDWITFVPFDVS